ncbi:membrane protein YdbS with pleckstrin-like domain [Sporosarcina luteola]|nr:membrane protein YdbS with pleckstrin-like domain [Sporosarcina luteola]
MYKDIQEPSKRLAKEIIKVLRYSSLISHTIEAAILVAFYLLGRHFSWGSWSVWVLWIGIFHVVLSAIWGIGLRPLFIYKNTRYDINEDFLQIKTGAFHEQHELVPMTKIQAVSTKQGPILRKYDLYSIEIQTMGSGHGIIGLPKSIALDLRNQIAYFAKIREVDEG